MKFYNESWGVCNMYNYLLTVINSQAYSNKSHFPSNFQYFFEFILRPGPNMDFNFRVWKERWVTFGQAIKEIEVLQGNQYLFVMTNNFQFMAKKFRCNLKVFFVTADIPYFRRPGLPGIFGDLGVIGEPGPVGQPGYPGVRGDVGTPGYRGEVGDKGREGVPGANGKEGLPGIKGSQGETGPFGDIGSAGKNGRPGPPGLEGATGGKGSPGNFGPDGVPGVMGLKVLICIAIT